jgi:hypothetical protein
VNSYKNVENALKISYAVYWTWEYGSKIVLKPRKPAIVVAKIHAGIITEVP